MVRIRSTSEKRLQNSYSAHAGRIPGILFALFLFAFPLSSPGGAQFLTEKPLVPDSESRMWIHGSTTVSEYECKANEIRGFGFLADTVFQDRHSGSRAVVEVQVPVRRLNCGNPGMNRDMYEALKSDQHPHIHYELSDIKTDKSELSALPDSQAGWLSVRAEGRLTIAGSTRTITMRVNGRQLDEQKIRVRGHKRLNMKNYGVDPPTALFGLVRAKDSLTVHFDIVTYPADTLSRQKMRGMLGPNQE